MTPSVPADNRDDLRREALDTLRRHWGYETFRPMQEQIILSALEGHDTLGLLPTGGGKSITFQVPALMLPGITIVVTPLISLMKDQVDNLRDAGIRAVCIHSGISRREYRLAMDRIALGKAKLLYVSPERLKSERFIDELRPLEVSMIVVDEAHCISQWGYDFRPSYLNIASLRTIFPRATVMALTASATPAVTADIMEQLKFRGRNMFARSFSRSNLSYIVRPCELKDPMLLRVLRGVAGSAIVYVRSRRRTRDIARMLTDAGISAAYYHAGIAPEEKAERQQAWKEGAIRVMVATNAFGMGIDKPDVRVVVHYDLPMSLEEYYQEAGRAGRDGLHSYAVLLTSASDKGLITRRVNEAFPDKSFIKRVYELAGNFLNVAVGDGYNRLYDFNFTEFCAVYGLKEGVARSALGILTRAGYLEYCDDVSSRARVMMLMEKRELYDLRLDTLADMVLQTLLRSYTGLFADYTEITESLLASRMEVSDDDIYHALLRLSREHVLHYIPRRTTPYILYTTSREEPRYITIPTDVYELRRRQMELRADAMKRFAFGAENCRVNTMLRYFGEEPTDECGQCDVCRSRRRRSAAKESTEYSTDDSILYLASQPDGNTIDYISRQTALPAAYIAKRARALADLGLIAINGTRLMAVKKN